MDFFLMLKYSVILLAFLITFQYFIVTCENFLEIIRIECRVKN